MAIGTGPDGIYSLDQATYQTVRDSWASTGNAGSLPQFLFEMLTQGGRGIKGVNDQGYASYAQIVMDLAAHGINVQQWGLPTMEQVNANPGNYQGVNGVGMPQNPPGVGTPPAAPNTNTAPVDSTPPPPAAPVATNPDQITAFRQVQRFLNDVGFGDLATVGPDGTPGGWLWDQVVKKGYTTPDEIQSALDNNAAWVQRFQVHYDQLKQVGTGAPTNVMSFADIRQYEKDAADLMKAYGMPSNLYDNYTDFQNLMRNGVSIQSLNKAITVSWNRVANAGDQVRQAFADLYGPSGDSLLASYFLDNAQFENKLDLMSRSASLKGVAAGIGLDMGKPLAEQLAQTGLEGNTARSGFMQVAGETPLFDESITENKDLTAETGIQSTFGLSGQAQEDVKARAAQRAAALGGGGGGIVSQQGDLSQRTAT